MAYGRVCSRETDTLSKRSWVARDRSVMSGREASISHASRPSGEEEVCVLASSRLRQTTFESAACVSTMPNVNSVQYFFATSSKASRRDVSEGCRCAMQTKSSTSLNLSASSGPTCAGIWEERLARSMKRRILPAVSEGILKHAREGPYSSAVCGPA